MGKTLLFGLAMCLAFGSWPALAQDQDKDGGFERELQQRASNEAEGAFALIDRAPADFKEYLGKQNRPNGMTNKEALQFYQDFKAGGQPGEPPESKAKLAVPAEPPAAIESLKAADPAASGGLFDGAKKFAESPWVPHVAGLEVGTGPHPNSDLSQALQTGGSPGWDIRGRAELQGLGATVTIQPPVVPGFAVSLVKYTDLVGELGLQKARDGLYKAFFSATETPLSGYQASFKVQPDPHITLYTSQDDRTYLDAKNIWNRDQATSVGAGVRPLGDNGGKDWNFTVIAEPGAHRHQSGSPTSPDDKRGLGVATGVSFQYALDKLPVKWLQPPPVGNGVLWTDYAKTTVELIASEITSPVVSWASELSFHITKYLQLTPAVDSYWNPKPIAAPRLGIDIQNPK